MSLLILAAVLGAALAHALWNTWLKLSGDGLAAVAALSLGWALVAVLAVPLVGMPAAGAWPYLLASVLVHIAYVFLLAAAYRHADLSVAYPVARGTGPLCVMLITLAFLSEPVTPAAIVSVVLIVGGVLLLGVRGRGASRLGIGLSVATGILIGAYTLLDGLGGRVGGNPHAYVAMLFLLTAAPSVMIVAILRRDRFIGELRPLWAKGVAVGLGSALAYWVVVWAMNYAPVALVAAVRESSVAFAGVFAALRLREQVQWVPVAIVFTGVVLARFAGV